MDYVNGECIKDVTNHLKKIWTMLYLLGNIRGKYKVILQEGGKSE